jgi:phage terminase small subunit
MTKKQLNTAKTKLPKAQQQFVENMANPLVKNQTEAYMKAYQCSYDTARANASRLLAKACISEAIRHRKQCALEHAEVSAQEVLGSAVFQMRSSMADVLNDEGSFDLNKAKDTGAIDLLKKHKETTRTICDKEGGCEVIKTVEVEMLTNQDARKEVANYIGLQQFAPAQQSEVEKFARVARVVAEKDGVTVERVFGIMVNYDQIPIEFQEEVGRVLFGDGKVNERTYLTA